MKYPIFALALVTLMLTACGEPKPGQKPPSLYKDREGLLSDSELETAKKQDAQKEASEMAKKVYPADDPVAPHAKSAEEVSAEKAEKSYPADDPKVPHAKSDEELSAEKAEKVYPADDPAAPHAKSDEELSAEKAEESYPADDSAAPRRGY